VEEFIDDRSCAQHNSRQLALATSLGMKSPPRRGPQRMVCLQSPRGIPSVCSLSSTTTLGGSVERPEQSGGLRPVRLARRRAPKWILFHVQSYS